MKGIRFMFPGWKSKSFTLSYDDAPEQDKRLIAIFNKHNLKCTFNVNSGIEGGSSWICRGTLVRRMDLMKTIDLYKGHEVAVHTLNHLNLTELDSSEIMHEIIEDKNNINKIFNKEIRGMAYPYGAYNQEVLKIVGNSGICYSRTINDTENFDIPEDFLRWNPTCRHANPRLMDIAERFVEEECKELRLFYLWGHSYEFDVNNNWDVIELFSEYISNRNNIWYADNIDIYDYITALKLINIEQGNIYNNSKKDIYLMIDDIKVKIRAGEEIKVDD